MRNITYFIRSKGLWHNAIFQMTVGGKILFALLNPFMWIMTILYFTQYSVVGPLMQEVYKPPYSYLAVVSLVFGNFLFLYSYMVAVAKRNQWDIAKYVFLIPIYWVMMSTAAMVALYQLILKPHYWEKTIHGFHLGTATQPEPKAYPVPAVRPAIAPLLQPVQGPVLQTSTTITDTESAMQGVFENISRVIKGNASQFIWRWMPLLAILNMDMLLARVFLSYEDAQVYIMLSLIGKSIFLLSNFGSNLMTEYVANNKMRKAYLYRLIFFTFFLNWIGYVVFGLEGNLTIPALFGTHMLSVIPYMGYYLFGMMCFSLVYRLTTFNFYKKTYTYSMVTLALVLLEIPFVYFHHDTLFDVVISFAYVASLNLLILIGLEMSAGVKLTVDNNIASILSLFDKSLNSGELLDNNMRILVFNWRDTQHRFAGGAEVYIQELAKRWVAAGNKVTLFCGNDNDHVRYEVIDGIEIYRKGGTYTVYLFAFIFYFFKFRGKYDVIVDCENGIPFFTPLYAKEQVVLLIHHVHQEIFRNFLSFPLNIIAEVLEGRFMPVAYHNKNVVTVSASSQKDIMKLGITDEKNIQIIPNGVNESLFVNHPKTDNPSYIYLGRLKDYKNIDIAIKAFAKVVKVKKNATLSIVGDGESYMTLEKLVADLGIERSVTFYGRVNEEKKAALLSKSWAALQPSQLEGWGLTVIEANAAGTPVIASQVNGLQDSVINGLTGILVPAGSVVHFANAMMRIADEDVFRLNLSEEARIWARNFDWSKSADAFSSLIGRNFGQGVLRPSYSDMILSSFEKGMNEL